MATEITMPKLSDTMTEGQLGAWRKSVGERIERGDIIAEVETDKATMDLEAFSSGILLEQRVQPGEVVPVGSVIGLIGEAGEAASPPTQTITPPPPEPVSTETAPLPAIPDQPPFAAAPEQSAVRTLQAAPVVRRRAEELGLDLAQVPGSGPGGRVMLEDLERHLSPGSLPPAKAVAEPQTGAPSALRQSPAAAPLSRMRGAIARTTSDSWRTIPHFYLTREIEMDQAELVIRGLQGEGIAASLNALILSAAAQALAAFPALNAGYIDGGIVGYPDVNLAFAVALEDGLQMPVIRRANDKGVRELTDESSRLAAKARQGGLSVDDISEGSFSVSNLGMYGVDSLASIIMPGQAAILGIGTVADRPLVRNGALQAARLMTATLSCDHRIVDGTTAADFLGRFKQLLEYPAELPA
jgi:pyruvate dehydrogenase E2 component (dihydrolipoamide acetyltransferase)